LDFKYESNKNFFALGDALFYFMQNGNYAIIRNGKVSWEKIGLVVSKNSRIFWNNVSRQVFIYSDRNLYNIEFDSKRLTSSVLISDENLAADRVNALYFDRENRIVYLGSSTKGFCIYKLQPFHTITHIDSSGEEVFYALHELDQNRIISSSGVIMDHTGVLENLNFKNSEKYTIAIDDHHDIWVYKHSKLFRYNQKDNYKKFDQWDMGIEIVALFKAKDGTIWFNTNTIPNKASGLYCFKPEDKPVFKKIADTPFPITCFAQNDENQLWIAGNGLHWLDIRSKKIYSVPATKAIKIRSIYISDTDKIWLTTYENGFFLYQNNKWYSFPVDKNKYLMTSHSIIEDKKGFFWIATNKGLFQVSKKNLLDHTYKKTNPIYYHYYNKDAGFMTNEFNGGGTPCNVILRNGDAFLPSMDGVVSFNTNTIKALLPSREIYIDEIQLDNKKIPVADTIRLQRNFNRITFFITSPYYGNINNLDFEAKLDGGDSSGWTKISDEHNISFTKLQPGNYKLTIRKMAGFGSDYVYKKIILIIEPLFWQTLWFRILALIGMVLLLFLMYKSRTKYIKNKNILLEKKINDQTQDLKNTISTLRATKENLTQQFKNNTKIIQYITHDIKSPLKFMAMASKYMYETFDENTESLKENIQSIYTSSSQMFNFVDNLLEYSKVSDNEEIETGEFILYDLVNEKIPLFMAIATAQKTAIKNLIPKNYTLRTNKQLFTIVIHNLLDNAIKNTIHGNIIFTSHIKGNKIYILIADNGNGMSKSTLDYYQSLIKNYDLGKDKTNKKIGLHIVIELLLILNGKIKIKSQENKGTTISLVFGINTEKSHHII
jgi:signal transduction histidine kinase